MKKIIINLKKDKLNLLKKVVLSSLAVSFLILSIYYFPEKKVSYDAETSDVTIHSRMFDDDTYKITPISVSVPDISNKNHHYGFIPEKDIFDFFSFQRSYIWNQDYSYDDDYDSLEKRFEVFRVIIFPCIFTFKIWTLLLMTALISFLIISVKYIKKKVEINVK